MATVLIIDDEPLMRRAFEKVLLSMSHQVLQAENGQEALNLIQEKGSKIDLILLDWIMPVMGGEMVLKELQKQKFPLQKVWIITAFDPSQLGPWRQKVGSVIQKPIENIFDLAQKIT